MSEGWDARQHRQLAVVLTVAFVWRVVLAARTPVPSVDGVTYLWMAQQFAAGHPAAALAEPFSPLWPLLLAAPIRLGCDPVAASQVLGCLCSTLVLVPIAAIAGRLRPGAWLPAVVLAGTARSLCLPAVEGYTEPLFALVLAFGASAGLAGQWWRLGCWSALAFLVRPEGVLLPLPFLTVRAAWRALLPCGLAVAAFGAWRAGLGLGFDPVPKLRFHEQREDLGDARGAVGANLLQLPGVFAEAFLVAGGAALAAAWPPRARGTGRLWALLGLGLVPMLTFVVRRRFFGSWAPVVLALAALGLTGPRWLTARIRALALAVAVLLDLWTGFRGTIDADRIAELQVGRQLAAQLRAGETVVGDMTRVLWFAGQRPLPPRHFDADWFVRAAEPPSVRYVVLSRNTQRGTFADIAAGIAASFRPGGLPPGLAAVAEQRGIAVFERR